MNLQDEKKKFSEKLIKLQIAISDVEGDFNYQCFKNTDPSSATGRILTLEVFEHLQRWRESYNILLRVINRSEEYENKGDTTDALNELIAPRDKLGHKSPANILDDMLEKIKHKKADMLDVLSEICDAATKIGTVFQELRQPLEAAINQYNYALTAVPDVAPLMTALKQYEVTLLADPVGFQADSSGMTTLRDRVKRVVAELEQTGRKLADVPMLKNACTELLVKLPKELSEAQEVVRNADLVSAPLPTVREYVDLVKYGKNVLKALESDQISNVNDALQWQAEAHKMLANIRATLTGIEAQQIKLAQVRSKFRNARSTITEYGFQGETNLNDLIEKARKVLATHPVDVIQFEQIVTFLFSEIQDLRKKFS